MPSALLFRVAASHHLPGLGLLLLPDEAVVLPYGLHTVLPVQLRLPTGQQLSAPASVEEVSHNETTPAAALLLQAEELLVVPAGTEVWTVSS